MKVLSLFDGIACGYEALKRAWIPFTHYYASEIDKYAIQVALKNHPDIIEMGDVNDRENWPLDWIDLIFGGSPCQWFSMAGKMLNFNDPRSALFFKFVDIVKYYKPKYFLLENVKMKKEYIEVINEQLWGIEPTLIDSALVSAQRRKRLYRVGKLQDDGTYAKVEIPQPEDRGILLKDILLNYVEPKYDISEKHTIAMKNARSCGELNLPSLDWKCWTIIAWYYKTPQDGPYILKDYILTDKQIDMISKRWGYEKPLERVRWPEDKMDTLTTHCGKMSNGIKLVSVPKIRKLHPIEVERLQTLPDWYTEGISDTRRYIALWNGRTVDAIAHIFSYLK